MRLVLSVWTWWVLFCTATLGFVVVAAVAVVTSPFDRNRRLAGTTFRKVAKTAITWVPLWRFEARGEVPDQLRRPHVVVSNHESHLDAFLISHLPVEMKWLAKQSLFRLPFIGWMMALAGDVAIVRGARNSTGQALGVCRRYLDQGMSVFLFPEGTRATGEALQPFKSGAFRLALEAGCPVLPLAVAGTRGGLAKGSMLFGRCRAVVQVGTAVETAPYLAAHRHQGGELAGQVDLQAATAALLADVRQQVATIRDGLRQELNLRA